MLVHLFLGMDVIATYTPLECLLVFQSLAALGTDEKDFISISELLKNSPLVRNCPSYDAKRLEANALRELYIRLLREELRVEEQDGQEQGKQATSRKRKIPSPKLRSFNDFRQYQHKLPLLVDRLYARYREHMIKSIEEDERNYVKLQGQIEKIERGFWDESLMMESEALGRSFHNISSTKTNGIHLETFNSTNGSPASVESPLQTSQAREIRQPELASKFVSNSSEIKSSQLLTAKIPGTGYQTVLSQKNIQKQSLLSLNSNTQIQAGLSPGSKHDHSTQELLHQQNIIELKTPHRNSQVYNESTQKLISEFPIANPSQTRLSSSLASSKIMEIPLSPYTPVRTSGTLINTTTNTGNQECRTPEQHLNSPRKDTQDKTELSGNSLLSSHTKSQHSKQQYSLSRSSHAPFKSNSILNQISPSEPLLSPKSKKYSSPYCSGLAHRPMTPSHFDRLDQNTNSISNQKIVTDPFSHNTRKLITGYGTAWNPIPTGLTPCNFVPLPPPKIEPLSPILKPSKVKLCKKIPRIKLRKIESPLSIDNSTESSSVSLLGDSNLLAERHHDSQSEKSPITSKKSFKAAKSFVENKMKIPSQYLNAEDTIVNKSTTCEPSKSSRLSPSVTERKPKNDKDDKSQSPSTVLWTRAFPRISAQALQDISTDKNAGMFANPIKEKDAPGYRNIIFRPQDLKSIRSAIITGHRAALAVAPDDLSPNTTSMWLPISEDLMPPKGIINYAQLEKELMRMFANAIMFNAEPRQGPGSLWQDAAEKNKEETLGYSFDEDSVVKGTRDMFAAVEKKVSDLRSVERRNEKYWTSSLVREQEYMDEEDELQEDENEEKCRDDNMTSDLDSHIGKGENLVKRRKKP